MTLNAKNERVKHRYFSYLKEARQLDEQSIDAVAAAIDRFESNTRHRDFDRFRPEQASAFKADLVKQRNSRTGKPLSKPTLVSVLSAVKAFFFWLAGQPGFKSHLRYDWADYFNPSFKDLEIAKARRTQRVPSLDQIHGVIAVMPSGSAIEKRDRALVALTILTGARDNAIASMRLRHIDLEGRVVHQDGRDVRTKFGKTFDTWFFPVGGEAERVVREWIDYLRKEKGFGPDAPLFPATRSGFGADGQPAKPTLGNECWSTATPIRHAFRVAFALSGLPYFNPHSFRNTLARLGMERCLTPEALKAWSQNIGHDDVLTTFTSYGEVPAHRQRELVEAAGVQRDDDYLALELGRKALAAARQRL